jgi:hypothetical protein
MSDNDENLVENIKHLLLENLKPSYQTTSHKEIRVRCPYCGDSKNPSSAHMYIEMKPPFRYHCFKCESAGILTQQTLRDFGLFNNELSTSIINANKTLTDIGIQHIAVHKAKNLITNLIDDDISKRNLAYFNKRYDLSLTNEYITKKFKAVTEPLVFIKDNDIFVPAGQYDFANCIGFISADASHIIFRDTSGKQEQRYYNLNIAQDEGSPNKKIYNISNDIDILQPKINLIMTEGIFDIIGVYEHFYKDTENEKNTIFAAACGKSYASVINKYINMGFLDMDISIYSDADVDFSFYQEIKRKSIFIKDNPITVYYNDLYDHDTGYGKDYGVPKKDIKLRKLII